MKRGVWHQCGHQSQTVAADTLQKGAGVGVIISPRDLTFENATERAKEYHDLGAHVLVDQQFYAPSYGHNFLKTYPTNDYRISISKLDRLDASQESKLAKAIEKLHREIGTDGIIAPAVIYEAARSDIVSLNARLFEISKNVGDSLGVPTYATVALGQSHTQSSKTLVNGLSAATALNADGWYFAFEFDDCRIPYQKDWIWRCCEAGLTLAATGRPVLHGFAGPLAPLSFGFGATGAGIGHAQNLWHFHRSRWNTETTSGGRGDAPRRFWSSSLWGTIIYPDEVVQLPNKLANRVLTHSPFLGSVSRSSPGPWSKAEADRHLVYCIGMVASSIADSPSAKDCAKRAINWLWEAVKLHNEIREKGIFLGDETDAYQSNWHTTMQKFLAGHESDYQYLRMLKQ